jgi:sugar/nucleoside kinase (ribokinase family)
MKKVFCAGLVVCDVPLRPVPRFVFDQDRVIIEQPVYAVGGDAANVATALVKLGARASLCGFVGNDANGDFVFRRLTEAGVDVRGLARHPRLGTVVSHILIEPEGERHFLIYTELSGELDYKNIPENMIEEADLVYLGSAMGLRGMDGGGTAALFKKAHALGKITAADFKWNDQYDSDYWLKLLDPMLRETDVLLPSYREAVTLTGKKNLPAIRQVLSGYGIKILAVKLGNEGCYITDFKEEWKIPAFPDFKPLDTTGAGDSFAGGFIRGLLAGWKPEAAGIFANAVAGYNITKLGATGGVPDFETAYRYVTEHGGGPNRFPLSDL